MNLNDKSYAEFRVSYIFKIKYGFNLELEACEQSETKHSGIVNFVARTAEDNGVSAYVQTIDSVIPQEAGLISVAGGGSVLSTFLQNEPFYSGRDLYTLEAKNKISDEAKMFIITVIEQNKYKYSYGRQANKTLPDLILKLPINNKGDPDYEFMEKYIKSLHNKPITTKIKPGKAPNLNIYSWKSFQIKKIFTLMNGKGITQEEIDENPGDFAAVQSAEENNGVMGKIDLDYCKSMNYTFTEKPCLTVARSGSAGFVSYQVFGCVVGDSAKILLLPDEIATETNYLFLQTLLTANRFKYSYGRKVTEDKYLNEYISLPIKYNTDGFPVIDKTHRFSDDGFVPDWNFMDKYIKSLPYSDRLKIE